MITGDGGSSTGKDRSGGGDGTSRGRATGTPETTRISVGPLTVDLIARTVRRGEQAIELQPKEFDLLALGFIGLTTLKVSLNSLTNWL